ncbi:MAG: 2-hydroxymuconate-semialdehyde hydrolase [Verrucomicrobiales bacterium]|jgi:2-hydroxymuconate-semialdehyde hydrolase
MAEILHRYVDVLGLRTHYVEAGEGPVLVLLHSGEFGASAELSWEFTIPQLSSHFRVIAPDWLGFGESAKVFDFTGMQGFRIRHIGALLETLGIPKANFAGNSMGGGQLLRAAAKPELPWPIDKMVLIGAGGRAPKNDARRTLDSYDGTREQMEQIVRVLIQREELRTDPAYIDRRHRSSLEPGAWEATAAPRFTMPGRAGVPRQETPLENVRCPTLIIAGALDPLREPGFGDELHRQIKGSELIVIEEAGHCPQIDAPQIVNRAVIDFLVQPS